MDPVTHALVGSAVQELGLRQKIGRDALIFGALAGCAPDLDIFIPIGLKMSGNAGPLDMFVYHRGVTHSFIIAPIIALLCAFIWLGVRKLMTRRAEKKKKPAPPPVSFWLLFLSCFIAVICHDLLDAFTSYGTQLLWPLPDRAAWDSVAIIDMLFTAIPAAVLIACFFVRKLMKSSLTRAARVTTYIGIIGLVLMSGYLAGGRVLRAQAIKTAAIACENQRVANGTLDKQEIFRTWPGSTPPQNPGEFFSSSYHKRGSYPVLGTPFIWRVVFENDKEWVICAVNLLKPDEVKITTAPRQHSAYIELARNSMHADKFDWFTNRMLRAEVLRQGPVVVVDFHDMRYGYPIEGKDGLWALRFIYNDQAELLDVKRIRTVNRHKLSKRIMKRILGEK